MSTNLNDPRARDSRERIRAWVERPRVQNFIIALILLNAALLGLETSASAMAAAGGLIVLLDSTILGVFVVEIALRLYAHRAAFWRDPWSVFDFAVVTIALVPATGPLAVLRALRVLRVLRLLTMVPSMRRVVGALLAAIPGLGSIALVLLIVYYVFAVIATKLFAATHPEWFGDLGRSLYTLFQIMTLESWSMGIARPVMENFPYAWAFFVTFILVATFTMLNLFIAIIVNAMQSYTDAEQHDTRLAVKAAREHIEADLHAEMRSLRDEIRALQSMLSVGATAPSGFLQTPSSDPTAKENP
ncbi:MAG: Ion transport protein [Candidatus Accumulibacter regalis]|jgi:voltage-gated sodium channel|uniref:Ion transport protein n=1 Tax=Accumulibacter regalis TaxID=522306 RepID=A0A011RHP9_ACCRE|nr:ion transporter [Accumulibacter sp.]EXI90734.1 MAG: Ion transport protein [Candidatus Accumulibacter regalis]MQM34342.1 ion transporter [Candidatus Accumulibacter phosphatis]MBL8367822.1 ion transporter [Accumulibacter sp.]MBN8514472.1 ion transporter [Accumulibacter sp.]MBO3702786.1 ion transporter [Accumulibacter sp.]